MVDIRLLNLTPPPTATKPASVTSSTEGSVLQPLPGVESGTVLTGFILNRDAAGNPILRTESGDITFASPFFLKIGSEVTIRIEGNPAQAQQARILTVDGKPPEIAAQLSAFANEPDVLLSSAQRPPNPLVALNATVAPGADAPDEGLTVFATLVKPAATPATAAQSAAPTVFTTGAEAPELPPPVLPTGTQLTLRIVSVTPPPTPAAAPAQPAAAAPTTTLASPPLLGSSYAAYARASGINTVPVTSQPNTPVTPVPPAAPAPASSTFATSVPSRPGVELPQQPMGNAAPLSQNVTPQTPATPAVSAQATQIPENSATPTPAQTQPNATPAVPNPAQPAPNTPQTPATAPVTAPNTALTSPQPVPPGSLAAQVLGHEPGGDALLQTPLGVVRLPAQTALPVGSSLQFRLVQTTPPPLATLSVGSPTQPISTQPAPLLELATGWTSLQQLLDVLANRFGLTAGLPLSIPGLYTAPQAQPAFTPRDVGPGILLFLSMLRGGDLREWLGTTNAEWLEKNGYGNLLKKAQNEFASLGAQYAEPKASGWQALFFPVAVDGMLQQVRLFTKRDRKQRQPGEPEKPDDTRFVLELDLTQLGELQLDGFVRKHPREVQFDMVIRSLLPLSPEIQQDILAIYNASGAIAGFRGGLTFQHVREFPVSPMKDIAGQHPDYTV